MKRWHKDFPRPWGKARKAQRTTSVEKREIDPGEKCLECKAILDADRPLFLVSPYGYACSKACSDSYGRKRRHFLDVVIGDGGLTAKWLRGDDFPGDQGRGQVSRPRRRFSGASNGSGWQSRPRSGYQK